MSGCILVSSRSLVSHQTTSGMCSMTMNDSRYAESQRGCSLILARDDGRVGRGQEFTSPHSRSLGLHGPSSPLRLRDLAGPFGVCCCHLKRITSFHRAGQVVSCHCSISLRTDVTEGQSCTFQQQKLSILHFSWE